MFAGCGVCLGWIVTLAGLTTTKNMHEIGRGDRGGGLNKEDGSTQFFDAVPVLPFCRERSRTSNVQRTTEFVWLPLIAVPLLPQPSNGIAHDVHRPDGNHYKNYTYPTYPIPLHQSA